MKLNMYISMVCIGTWGLLSASFQEYGKEIFLGMFLPLITSLISISKTHSVYNKNPDKLINHMTTAMLMKMLFYGLLLIIICLLYTSPSPRDGLLSRMPSSA